MTIDHNDSHSRNRNSAGRQERTYSTSSNRPNPQSRQGQKRSGQEVSRSNSSPSARKQPNRVSKTYSRNAPSYRNRSDNKGQKKSAMAAAQAVRSASGMSSSADRASRNKSRVSSEPVNNSFQDYGKHAKHSRKRPNTKYYAVAAALLVAVGFGAYFFMENTAYAVTVNGSDHEFSGEKTLAMLVADGHANPKPGNLVAVDGTLLETGKGERFSATINGKTETDPQHRIRRGDTVVISDGLDKTEPFTESSKTIKHEVVEEGTGPLHIFEGQGTDGVETTKTGSISGIVFTEEETPATDQVYRRYFPSVGNDKVVALTFDDGPWPEHTAQILSVLKENKVKATFFTVGECIDANRKSLVKQAFDDGHQICTHTFSHARGKGGSTNMGAFTAEEQVEEVEKGFKAIESATGKPASKVMRAPGGTFSASSRQALCNTITAEIGWTIDTGDWKQPGVEKIVAQITSAKSGDVILLHDGGGNRTQTIEALKIALPKLKAQGFRFVTIDEMLEYPVKPA